VGDDHSHQFFWWLFVYGLENNRKFLPRMPSGLEVHMKIHSSIKRAAAAALIVMGLMALPSFSFSDSGLSEEDVNKAALDYVKEMAGPLLDFLSGEVTPQAIQDLQETKDKVDNFMNLVDKAARGNLTNADMLKEAYSQIQGAGAKFLPSPDLLDKLVKTIQVGQKMKKMADALQNDNEALNVLDTFRGAYPDKHDGIPGVRTDAATAKSAYSNYVSRGGLDNKYSRYMKRKFGFSTSYFEGGKWPAVPDGNTIYGIQSMLKDADALYTSINSKIRAQREAAVLRKEFEKWLALTPGDFESVLEALQRAKESLKYKEKIPEYRELLTDVQSRLAEARLLMDSENPWDTLEKCNSLADELNVAKTALEIYVGNQDLISQLVGSYDSVRGECGIIENELDKMDVAGGKGCFDGQEPVYESEESEVIVGCTPPCQEGQELMDVNGMGVCVSDAAAKKIDEENEKEVKSDWDDPDNECRRQKCPEGQQAGCALEEVNGRDVARFTGCEDIPDPMVEPGDDGSGEADQWEKEWEANYKRYHAELDEIAKKKKDDWESSFGESTFSNEWRDIGWGEAIIMNDVLRSNLNNIYQRMMTLRHNVDLNRERMVKAKAKVDALAGGEDEFEPCQIPGSPPYGTTMSVSGAMRSMGKNGLITMVDRDSLEAAKKEIITKRRVYANIRDGSAGGDFKEYAKHVSEYKRFASEYIRLLKSYGPKINIINENLDAILSASQQQIATGHQFPRIEQIEFEDLNFANKAIESCARGVIILNDKLKEVNDLIGQASRDEATLKRILNPVFKRIDMLKGMSGHLKNKSWGELKLIAREVGYVTTSTDDVYLKNRLKKIGPLIRSSINSSSGLLLPEAMFWKIGGAVERDIPDLYMTLSEPLTEAMAGSLVRELKKIDSKIRTAGSRAKLDTLSNQVNVILKKTSETTLDGQLSWRFSDVLEELQKSKLKRLGALGGIRTPGDINRPGSFQSEAANFLVMVMHNCGHLTPGSRYNMNEAKTCMSQANEYMKRYDGYNDPEAVALYSALSSKMSWITGEALPAIPVPKKDDPPGGGQPGSGGSVDSGTAPAKAKVEDKKTDTTAKKKTEEEAKQKADEVSKKKTEEEANQKADEVSKKKAEEEAKLKADEAAKKKTEAEAKLKADEAAKKKAEAEEKLKAEEAAKKKAEEAANEKAEEEKRIAEEEARKEAEEARLQEEEEAEVARQLAEEEAQEREEEAKRQARELREEKSEDLMDDAVMDLEEIKSSLGELVSDPDSAGVAAESLVEEAHEIIGKVMSDLAEIYGDVSDAPPPDERLMATLAEIKKIVEAIETGSGREVGGESSQARLEEIRNFYQSFADAYSSKDIDALVAKLSESWTSATGSDLMDLEDIIDNSFSIFDRIEYGVSGLTIQPVESGQFEVKYQSKIVGYISDQGIHHTEVTEITEILGYEDGEIRILKTTSGQFWQE
jgi:hypothetical protein